MTALLLDRLQWETESSVAVGKAGARYSVLAELQYLKGTMSAHRTLSTQIDRCILLLKKVIGLTVPSKSKQDGE